MSDQIVDSNNAIPWKDQPTPIVDLAQILSGGLVETGPCNTEIFIHPDDARNLERRMRAAEALLKRIVNSDTYYQPFKLLENAEAHLDAAKKDDEQ